MASKQLTRTEFLKLSAGFIGIGAVPFTLGCPSDDTTDDGADSENGSTSNNPTTTGVSSESTADTPGTTVDPDSTSTGEPPGGTDSTSTGEPPGTESTSGDSTTGEPAGCTTDPDIVIGMNHGHEMVVSLAEVMAGVQIDYDIQGTSMHPHTVTLTAEHFMMLQQGMEVMVVSSNSGHTHTVTVSCG